MIDGATTVHLGWAPDTATQQELSDAVPDQRAASVCKAVIITLTHVFKAAPKRSAAPESPEVDIQETRSASGRLRRVRVFRNQPPEIDDDAENATTPQQWHLW